MEVLPGLHSTVHSVISHGKDARIRSSSAASRWAPSSRGVPPPKYTVRTVYPSERFPYSSIS